MTDERWVADGLAERDARGLRRRLRVWPAAGGVWMENGRRMLNFSSNDYLDLAAHPVVVAAARAALERWGAGATASRLVAGSLPVHEELETRLAAWKGYPAALVFGSGYAANTGILPALVGEGDAVFADRLSHASLLDGIRLSGARLHRFRHNDPGHLRALIRRAPPAGRRMVVTESVFSMDGDLAPLADLADAAEDAGALFLVDEAHATGVFGPGGAGLVSAQGLQGRVTLCMGTLSKALGGMGGFVCCSAALKDWLVNHARAFIYSTAPAPAVCGAALGALDFLAREPGRGADLLARAAGFRAGLLDGGIDTAPSASQIVPVPCGAAELALARAEALGAHDVRVVAIRPPTVPPGTARLRMSVTLAHTPEDLERATRAVQAVMQTPPPGGAGAP